MLRNSLKVLFGKIFLEIKKKNSIEDISFPKGTEFLSHIDTNRIFIISGV